MFHETPTMTRPRPAGLRAVRDPVRAPGRRFDRRLLVACLALLTGRTPQADAAAWNLPPRSLYVKVSYLASSANDQFGFDGSTRPLVDGLTDYPWADRSVYAYAEYGLLPRLTLTAGLPLKRIVVHDSQYRYQTEGLGDAAAGLRLGLLSRGPWVLAGVSSLEIPTGYHRDTRPPLGAGQVDLSLGVEAGRSFYPRPAWAAAGLRYRIRSSVYVAGTGGASGASAGAADPAASKIDYADEMLYDLQFGWTFVGRITVTPAIRGAHAFRTDGNAFTLTSLPSTERWLKAGGGVTVRLAPHYDVSVEAMQTLKGRNTSRSIDLAFGVATSW